MLPFYTIQTFELTPHAENEVLHDPGCIFWAWASPQIPLVRRPRDQSNIIVPHRDSSSKISYLYAPDVETPLKITNENVWRRWVSNITEVTMVKRASVMTQAKERVPPPAS